MTIREAYRILKAHQEWRVGETSEITNAGMLSEAIEVVLKYVEMGIGE